MNMSIRFPHLGISLGYVAETVSVFGHEFTIYGILMTAGLLLGLAVIILRAGGTDSGDPSGTGRGESVLCGNALGTF